MLAAAGRDGDRLPSEFLGMCVPRTDLIFRFPIFPTLFEIRSFSLNTVRKL